MSALTPLPDSEAVRILASIEIPPDIPPNVPVPIAVPLWTTSGLHARITEDVGKLTVDPNTTLVLNMLAKAESYAGATDGDSLLSQSDAYFAVGEGLIALACQTDNGAVAANAIALRKFELATLKTYEAKFIAAGDAERLVASKFVVPDNCTNGTLFG